MTTLATGQATAGTPTDEAITAIEPVSERRVAATLAALAAAAALSLLSTTFLIGASWHLNTLGVSIVGVTALADGVAAWVTTTTVCRFIAWSRAKADQ